MDNQVEKQEAVNTENVVSEKAMKRGTIIQAVKAIAVLVCICLVCGALLALCNDLLYVTEEEKFNRSIQKIYPKFENDETFDNTPVSASAANASYGSVIKVYKSKDGAYVLTAKGIGGYGGTVTLNVAVGGKEDPTIKGWTIVESDGETLLANITNKHYTKWYIGKRVDDALDLGSNFVTNTTMTSTAINNAINMVAYYCMNELKLGSNPEGEAKQAVLALLGQDYAGYVLNTYNILNTIVSDGNKVSDILSDKDNKITYYMAGSGDQGDIAAYVYGSDDSRKIVVRSGNEVIAKSENVTGEETFYANILATRVMSFIYGTAQMYALIQGVEASDSATVYTVAGLKFGMPDTYVLEVTIETVDGKGKVTDIVARKSGYVDGDGAPAQSDTDKLIMSLKGATSETIDAIYTSGKVTGATQSANVIRVAVETALNDYDANIASND